MSATPRAVSSPPAGPVAETAVPTGSRSTEAWSPGRIPEGLIGPLLLMAGVTMIVLVSARMRARRRQMAAPAPRPGGGALPERAREDIERMAVDLEEVARSVSAILDTRMRALDALVHDADRRIARLEELAGERQEPAGAGADQDTGPAAETTDGRAAAREALAHHAGICGLADQGLSVQEIAERTGYQRGEVELVLSLRRATQSDGG